jgi:hypothetical protein
VTEPVFTEGFPRGVEYLVAQRFGTSEVVRTG